jgi:hypothetical protein
MHHSYRQLVPSSTLIRRHRDIYFNKSRTFIARSQGKAASEGFSRRKQAVCDKAVLGECKL